MACQRCNNSEVSTENYRAEGMNFRFCPSCAEVFGFTPEAAEAAPIPIVEQDGDEILGEEVVQTLPNEFIRNEGASETGMPLSALKGVCPKCGVGHVNNYCPREAR
jgi:hypothetical protein